MPESILYSTFTKAVLLPSLFVIVKVDVAALLLQLKACDIETFGSQSTVEDETGVSVVMFVKSLLVSESVILHVMAEPSGTD